MSIFRKFRKSIHWKFLAPTAALMIGTIILIGLTTYSKTTDEITRNIEILSKDVLVQADMNINRYYEDYDHAFLSIAFSQEYWDWLHIDPGKDPDNQEPSIYSLLLNQQLKPFLYAHPEVLSIVLYNTNGNERQLSGKYKLDPSYSLGNEAWLPDIHLSPKIRFIPAESTSYRNLQDVPERMQVITMVRKFDFGDAQGYVKADISLTPTIQLMNNMILGNVSTIMITNADRILVSLRPSEFMKPVPGEIAGFLADQSSGFHYSANHDAFVSFHTISYPGWKTVAVIPYSEVAGGVRRVRNTIAAVVAFSALAYLLLQHFITKTLTRRMRRLQKTMKQVQMGNLDIRAKVVGEDEVSDLANSYNLMLSSLKSSLETLYETKLTEQKAIIGAMQSQINSHFLYNTLECINSMAILADHKQIEQTALALSDMLRYTSNFQNSFVLLEQELAHTQNYLQIVQIRFGDKVAYSLDADPSYLSLVCLKATIQPIVENCVKHAVEIHGRQVCIRICILPYMEDYVQIVIEDNGGGFDPEMLDTLTDRMAVADPDRQLDRYTRIGLLNVHYRIRLSFPEIECGLRVENISFAGDPAMPGARVRMIIPSTVRSG